MKKVFLAIAAVIALSTVEAQAGILDFGITAGMNMTKADVELDEGFKGTGWNPDNESGWYAGIQFRVALPILGVGVDFGAIYDQETIKVGEESETAGYLSIPVNLRYEINLPVLNKLAVPYVFTGPKASYNVNKIDMSVTDQLTLNNIMNNDLNLQNPMANFQTEDLVWHWNVGFGAILFDHIQVSYNYGFPLTKTASFVTGEKPEGNNIENFLNAKNNITEDFNLGTHSIGVTLFF